MKKEIRNYRSLSFSKRFTVISIAVVLAFVSYRDVVRPILESEPSNDAAMAFAAAPSTTVQEQEGWRTIHVFYGKEKEVDKETEQPGQWFSQVGQDRIVVDLLGGDSSSSGGYFIDLAANDPVKFSNTLALERRGWTGLCIEPNPSYWYGLAAHRACTVVGALVGGNNVEKVDFEFNGVYGGIIFDANQAAAKTTETRYTAGFSNLLEKFHAPQTIDYLSLDVEGAEYFIMQNFPFHKYMIRIMTVERPTSELRALLEANGYVYLKTLGWFGETLWAHHSLGYTPTHPTIEGLK